MQARAQVNTRRRDRDAVPPSCVEPNNLRVRRKVAGARSLSPGGLDPAIVGLHDRLRRSATDTLALFAVRYWAADLLLGARHGSGRPTRAEGARGVRGRTL